jgi:putative iron-dependent peroxidase
LPEINVRNFQPGVLAPVPLHGRFLTFRRASRAHAHRALRALGAVADGEHCVVGLGLSLLRALKCTIPGMRRFPAYARKGVRVPSTPAALWCWLRGAERGELFHRSAAIARAVAPAFRLDHAIDAFRHGEGRDLTGYEDGTENPRNQKAVAAAIVGGVGAGLDGSTFASVQRWVHDFDRFNAMSVKHQDNSIGRRRRDNVELGDAPASAHVKRTAQESFTPEAFIVRRSMPWSDATRAGLMFVAFGCTLDAFEAQLKRMAGAEDGIVDALFKFTQPVTGCHYWCPPLVRGKLDLRRVF